MASMDGSGSNINRDKILAKARELIDNVEAAVEDQIAAHKVEKKLLSELLAIGFMLMSYLFELHKGGDRGDTLELNDGRQLKRLPRQHARNYLSIFGEFTLSRWVYGTREGQKIENIPMDQSLKLPEKKYSYLLQDWTQSFAAGAPYAEAVKIIQRIFSITYPVSGLERTALSTSESAPAFFDQQTDSAPVQKHQIIVASADGKGVVIRKPSAAQKNDTEETDPPVKPANVDQATPKGHFGKKKMAIVGSVYNVDPYPRSPAEFLESLFQPADQPKKDKGEDKKPRPKPVSKFVRACMDRDKADTLLPARQTIFSWLDQEIKQRHQSDEKTTVVMLMDGEEKLRQMSEAMEAAPNKVLILDIIHAASYVWKAVEALNPDNSIQDNTVLVKGYIDKVLQGQVSRVIRSFRYLSTSWGLSDKALEQVKTSAAYLEKNADRMHYDEYLAAGYPIGSGIIEGACRHIIVDRMEGSGMRWVMSGAKAMLNLRCIYINEAWDQFMDFNIQQEQQRIHSTTVKNPPAANDDVFLDIKIA